MDRERHLILKSSGTFLRSVVTLRLALCSLSSTYIASLRWQLAFCSEFGLSVSSAHYRLCDCLLRLSPLGWSKELRKRCSSPSSFQIPIFVSDSELAATCCRLLFHHGTTFSTYIQLHKNLLNSRWTPGVFFQPRNWSTSKLTVGGLFLPCAFYLSLAVVIFFRLQRVEALDNDCDLCVSRSLVLCT